MAGKTAVLGVFKNGIAKAYPIKIMDQHEIVNDQFSDQAVTVTYCPLCGSGVAFLAEVDGSKRVFVVSGLLYNSDVLLYDKETESLWSQIMGKAISGQELSTINLYWFAWHAFHPDTLIYGLE